ncbi:hypothetical protein D8674_038486 [Pyrus ussuriensis x Pyrus communis]|uniref:Uncharacterized protein n=1 Tax=Pyrus ussuriensis x Pyrus communis TaxID=2448454 RepID=A0A5N5F7E9_9ROSA|nr:hypothetical protein D8674_038486 [Pyrus ussuriensis x Pyrus communis]
MQFGQNATGGLSIVKKVEVGQVYSVGWAQRKNGREQGNSNEKLNECGNNVITSTTSNMVSERGNFVVYTIDKRRFVLSLSYLSNHVFQKLFKMSKEAFGISSSEPIILSCDSFFMNYMVSLIKRGHLTVDTEKALLNSIASSYSIN